MDEKRLGFFCHHLSDGRGHIFCHGRISFGKVNSGFDRKVNKILNFLISFKQIIYFQEKVQHSTTLPAQISSNVANNCIFGSHFRVIIQISR
jgi:hypothetical protein